MLVHAQWRAVGPIAVTVTGALNGGRMCDTADSAHAWRRGTSREFERVC